MNLNFLDRALNNIKQNDFVQSFLKELSEYLSKEKFQKEENKLEEKGGLKEENALYQVVDMSLNGAFLQNKNSKQILEEKDIPQEVLRNIGNDFILRYKNGKYIIEEELTDEFFNNLEDIKNK